MRASCWCGRVKPCAFHTRSRNAPWSKGRDRYLQAKFRAAVLKRDGNQCTWLENGQRCQETTDLRACHRIPLRDFAADDPRAYHPANGRTLCKTHDKRTDPHAR